MRNSKGDRKRRRLALRQGRATEHSDFGALDLEARRAKGDVVELEETIEAGVRRARVRNQTIMDRYLLREQVSRRQYDAGQRLYAVWRASGRASLTISNYGLRIIGSAEMTDHQAVLRSDLAEALRAVGPRLSSILTHVCLCDEPAGNWGERHRGKASDGIAVLRLALDSLADYWGVPE